MQTILGAGGAIGTLLAKELITYTEEIRLVSRNPKQVNETDELFSADLLNADQVNKAVEGSEIVYLTVGLPYKTKIWQTQWPIIMQNTINACIKHKAKLVFFDNMYMYDRNHLANMDENTPMKAASKKGLAREKIVRMLLEAIEGGKLDALIARAPDFLGMHNSIIGQTLYANLLKGKKAMWFGNANKIHNYIWPADAARATAMLGNTTDAYNQVWHLPSTKENLTGQEWVNLFAQHLNTKAQYRIITKGTLTILGLFVPVMKEFKEMLYQYEQDYFFDSTKFEQRFNFTPIGSEEAVKLMIANKN